MESEDVVQEVVTQVVVEEVVVEETSHAVEENHPESVEQDEEEKPIEDSNEAQDEDSKHLNGDSTSVHSASTGGPVHAYSDLDSGRQYEIEVNQDFGGSSYNLGSHPHTPRTPRTSSSGALISPTSSLLRPTSSWYSKIKAPTTPKAASESPPRSPRHSSPLPTTTPMSPPQSKTKKRVSTSISPSLSRTTAARINDLHELEGRRERATPPRAKIAPPSFQVGSAGPS